MTTNSFIQFDLTALKMVSSSKESFKTEYLVQTCLKRFRIHTKNRDGIYIVQCYEYKDSITDEYFVTINCLLSFPVGPISPVANEKSFGNIFHF